MDRDLRSDVDMETIANPETENIIVLHLIESSECWRQQGLIHYEIGELSQVALDNSHAMIGASGDGFDAP
jgi:hypothetical protein